MDKPSARELREVAGISPSYAHMILNDQRQPPRPLAICIFRGTGWRHPILDSLTDAQIDTLEAVEPWIAPADRPSETQAAA